MRRVFSQGYSYFTQSFGNSVMSHPSGTTIPSCQVCVMAYYDKDNNTMTALTTHGVITARKAGMLCNTIVGGGSPDSPKTTCCHTRTLKNYQKDHPNLTIMTVPEFNSLVQQMCEINITTVEYID